MTGKLDNRKGITLIELLVAMAITGVVATAVFAVYFSQNRTYMVQEQVVDAQQDLRIAFKHLARDLRMAGLQDPFLSSAAGFQPASTSATTVSFTLDRSGGQGDGVDNDGDGAIDEADEAMFSDGDTNDADESITYVFSAGNLVRNNGSSARVLAANIDKGEFLYHLDDGTQTTAPASHQLDDIRMVEVTVLARTDQLDAGYADTRTYTFPSGDTYTPTTDVINYRRRMLTTTVRCRNMGL